MDQLNAIRWLFTSTSGGEEVFYDGLSGKFSWYITYSLI